MKAMRGFHAVLPVSVLIVTASILIAQPAAGKKYAFLVGINEYDHSRLEKLKFAENDARELGDLLKSHDYEVVVVAGESATRGIILKKLDDVLGRFRKGDTILIAFAGHGMQFDDQNDCFYCPRDAKPFSDQTRTLISLGTIYQKLERAYDGSKVLLVDACRNDPDPARGRSSGVDADNAPPPPKGVAALFSCSARQRAFEHADLKHGVFFHRVLEGLKGEAANKDGVVTWDSLSGYVREKVPDDVRRLIPGRVQTPNAKLDLVGVPRLVTIRNSDSRTNTNIEPSLLGKEITLDLGNGVTMEFVRIPAGEFQMGAPDGEENEDDERPQHRVRITKDFYMGKYEVTRGQFRRFVDNDGFKTESERDGLGGWGHDETKQEFRGPTYNDDKSGLKGPRTNYSWQNTGFAQTNVHPVVNVTWNDATAFCQWLTRTKKVNAFLPTEAQWEYACRAGNTTRFYSGDTETDFEGVGNVLDQSAKLIGGVKQDLPFARFDDGFRFTSPVGQFRTNKFGLFDMHGNVWEWCQDWYDARYYARSPASDPLCLDGEQKFRVLRGGSWFNGPVRCRAALRVWNGAFDRYVTIGFRAVLRLD